MEKLVSLNMVELGTMLRVLSNEILSQEDIAYKQYLDGEEICDYIHDEHTFKLLVKLTKLYHEGMCATIAKYILSDNNSGWFLHVWRTFITARTAIQVASVNLRNDTDLNCVDKRWFNVLEHENMCEVSHKIRCNYPDYKLYDDIDKAARNGTLDIEL